MKNNKICFIICGNNNFLCQETLHYILHLTMPDKFEMDYMVISEVKNIFEAYNLGMKESDAKYKIYLNENVFIIDKCFLVSAMDILVNNSNIGQIGAVGFRNSDTQETKSLKRIGRVVSGETETKICNFNCNNNFALEEVDTIDPNIIVTAHDEFWIEKQDVHTAMLERCDKMRNLGYKSVVLVQEKPWCLYDNNLLKLDEEIEKISW